MLYFKIQGTLFETDRDAWMLESRWVSNALDSDFKNKTGNKEDPLCPPISKTIFIDISNWVETKCWDRELKPGLQLQSYITATQVLEINSELPELLLRHYSRTHTAAPGDLSLVTPNSFVTFHLPDSEEGKLMCHNLKDLQIIETNCEFTWWTSMVPSSEVSQSEAFFRSENDVHIVHDTTSTESNPGVIMNNNTIFVIGEKHTAMCQDLFDHFSIIHSEGEKVYDTEEIKREINPLGGQRYQLEDMIIPCILMANTTSGEKKVLGFISEDFKSLLGNHAISIDQKVLSIILTNDKTSPDYILGLKVAIETSNGPTEEGLVMAAETMARLLEGGFIFGGGNDRFMI